MILLQYFPDIHFHRNQTIFAFKSVWRNAFLYANDAYTAYLEMGLPKELTTAQVAHLNDLTCDLPEAGRMVRSAPDGSLEITVSMNSNDIVLVKLARNYENH